MIYFTSITIWYITIGKNCKIGSKFSIDPSSIHVAILVHISVSSWGFN